MNESELPLFPEVRVGWRSWSLENGRLYSVLYVSYLNYKMVEPLSVYGVPVKVANPYTRRVHGNRLTQTDH
jgi:hypothetical protein